MPIVVLAVALGYLLHPAVYSTLLWPFHKLGLASGLYKALILSYVKKNRNLFIISLVALLMCRVDMPFTVFAFGIFALVDRRFQEGAWAMGLADAWWLFATKLVMPIVNGQGYWQAQPGRPLAQIRPSLGLLGDMHLEQLAQGHLGQSGQLILL